MTWRQKIIRIWKTKDLRRSILYVFVMLIIFRIAAHIPIPGVNLEALRNYFSGNQVFGLLNIFSGGALSNFSVVALGVGPYITASIIIQLFTMIVPRMEEISKEGEQGRQKINRWTRYLTVPMALMQGFGLIVLLRQQGGQFQILPDMSAVRLVATLFTLTAGTIFLMWLGELISEKHVGNGISLIIFAGIVVNIPTAIQRTLAVFDTSQLLTVASFLFIALLTTAGVVFITEAQRNIPVSYAKRMRGMRMHGGVDTHLPMRVNQAGMIPIIFAVSIILFPPIVAQFFINAKTTFVSNAALFIQNIFQNQLFYGIAFFLLVVGFTYFYTEIVFKPDQIAENLQKQGGFIPGVRPGSNTRDYLQYISRRIVFIGALFLGIIAVMPIALQQFTGLQTLTLSGASLLIVVSVVIESVKQIDAQLSMRDYEVW